MLILCEFLNCYFWTVADHGGLSPFNICLAYFRSVVRIRNPVPLWVFDPWSGMGKNSDPFPGRTSRIIFREHKNKFCIKNIVFHSFIWIWMRDLEFFWPWIRYPEWKNSDPKHPESATLLPLIAIPFLLSVLSVSIVTQKKWFPSSRKYDLRCRILPFYLSRIPDPGVEKAPNPDPQDCLLHTVSLPWW